MSEPINLDFSYDADAQAAFEEEEKKKAEAAAQAEAATKAEEETATATPQPTQQQQPTPEKKSEPTGVLANLNKFVEEETSRVDRQREEGFTTDNMSGRQRAVAGTIDTIMDLTSKFIPAMQGPADWWDEKTGRKLESDPLKKAERDISGIVIPSLLGGAGFAAAGLKGKAAIGANIGLEALISGTHDSTSEPGNIGNMLEGPLQKVLPGVQIPWATRDADSPDVIYWKNMAENLFTAGVFETLAELPTLIANRNVGNVLTPQDEVAEAAISAIPEKGGSVQDAILRNRAKKKEAQLREGLKALAEDPDGAKGYNAFVNEPAEAAARATVDETANSAEFMADQARIQNNVGTSNGRARPLLDNDTQELLARADAGTRANLMNKVSQQLGAKFNMKVGSETLSAKQVTEAVNALYDAAIAPIGKSFDDAVKQFRDLELKIGSLEDTVTNRGGRKIIGKTLDRLIDALSPVTQRASAAVQTQTASGVSDLARYTDLNEPVVDTSRLQELMMPRLRVLLKEQATSQVSESMATTLTKQLADKTSTVEGALSLPDNYLDEMFEAYTKVVDEKAQAIDEFVDNLAAMAKENPSFLRPVYKMWAKTNGEVDSMYKLNQYLDNRLGILQKAIRDQNPEVPSLILRELQAARTANMINGTAPATAWVGNLAALSVRPLTQLAGSVALGARTGKWKQLQRSLMAFGQVQEALRRASKMARDEWKYVSSNPEAAMARGRKDYDFSDTHKGWKETLSEYEEMEELSETFSPGRKALWNLTKGVHSWNGKAMNRWGVNVMYSADGFVKSMMASLDSRFKAYDKALSETNGVFDKAKFVELEKQFYNEAFDADGVIKDSYAKFASEEIALNADNEMIATLENAMDRFPIMKSIFMFPRTRANAVSVIQTFDPTGALSLWRDKSFKAITTNSGDTRAVKEVLEEHGMAGGSVDDFLMLKSEYIGRKLMASGVVTSAAMATVAGNMTGSGAWMSPADKKRALMAGWRPYTIFGQSYEKAPDWMRLFLSLTSDITMAHFGTEGTAAQDWLGTMRDVISANVSPLMFGQEIESLSDVMNMGPGGIERYLSGLVDTMIPGAGVRSALNDVVAPQLFDVQDNFQSYLANRNRWLTSPLLTPAVDPFTGNEINGAKYPLEKFMGRFMPFWESAGGDEPWRKWMLGTGWTGLSEPMKDPYSGQKLTPEQRQWINSWIGENGDWDKEMTKYMKWDKGDFEREWKRLHGNRAKLDISQSPIHEILNESRDRQFKAAWDAYLIEHPQIRDQQILKDAQKSETRAGNYGAALELQQRVENLNNMYR